MLLLVIIILATALPIVVAYFAAKQDYAKIIADGSADTLKEKFHAANLLRRLGFFVVAGAAVAFLADNWLILLAYLFYALCSFGYYFTQWLNEKRGLHSWYISKDPRAAVTDKTIIWLSQTFFADPYQFAKVLYHVFYVAALLLWGYAIGSMLYGRF